MIDLHCHILPGIDEGPDSFIESTEIMALAYESGLRGLVVTPCVQGQRDVSKLKRAKHLSERLNAYAEGNFLGLKIYTGALCLMTEDFKSRYSSLSHFTINDSKFVLIQFQAQAELSLIVSVVAHMVEQGFTPIIAQIESYHCLRQSSDALVVIKQLGGLVQASAMPLIRREESVVRDWVMNQLTQSRIDFVASGEAYGIERTAVMKLAYKQLIEQIGPAVALKVMAYNPDLVIKNAQLHEFSAHGLSDDELRHHQIQQVIDQMAVRWELIVAVVAFGLGALGLIFGLGHL